jgi:ferredoxin-NADP reductase
MNDSEHIVAILDIKHVTHDVKTFTVEKPSNYTFVPGQATEVSINKDNLKQEKRPFTFTSLNSYPYLEFTIKIYDDHEGVTKAMDDLVTGDELIIHDVWGAIQYKGPGYFIAGGAGITPFIAILRKLEQDSRLRDHYLIFSNRSEKDIILKEEFEKMLGDHFINTLTEEKHAKYFHRMIDKRFLEEIIDDFNNNFYVCGPDKMVQDIQRHLEALGASPESVVFEK